MTAPMLPRLCEHGIPEADCIDCLPVMFVPPASHFVLRALPVVASVLLVAAVIIRSIA